ncbi:MULTISPECIES: hypothetical protein [unclassified Bradyrhizobium]|uniref:hypothetical protein n=1 Tax=unclassified Bradyrhizobium TaxID=2631580 RepID=UPI001FF81AFC|nr:MULTISPECIES: hypothetical protein [unclassified Bradyrhizobium]MCK1554032.1 hypothetical protein [Bradyrhizobium sp. 177]MCK1575744.1 hypothetical protein [Bradyrhizobium sp. 174]
MTEELVGQWVGDLRGTDIGNVYVVVVDDAGRKQIDATVNVAGQISELTGHITTENEIVQAELQQKATQQEKEQELGTAKIIFDTVSPSSLTGRWSTSNGHAGPIRLSRWDAGQSAASPETPAATPPETPALKPIEIVAREGRLPNLSIYRSELEIIVTKLKALVGGPNDVVVAAIVDGRQIRQFSKDFFARSDLPEFITNINLSLNDGRQPITSVAIVNLTDKIDSTFFVQSDNAIWVSGSFSELEDLFRRYTNPTFVAVQRHGLNANNIVLLAAIALLPDLPLISRFVVLTVTFLLVTGIAYLHRRLTSTKIYLDTKLARGFLSKVAPSLVSALSAAAILGLIAWVYNTATLPNLQRLLGLH